MKIKRFKVLPFLLIFLLVLGGCASFTKTSYVALNESKDLYDVAMTTVATLQAQGLITPEKRLEINKVAKIYKEAHNTAVDALAIYKKVESAENKDKVIVALAAAASKWQQVAALVNAIKPNAVPKTFSK